MKKIFYSLTLILFLTSQTAFSQMDGGKYTFSNNAIILELTITGGGWTISSATVTNTTTKKTSNGTGEFRSANNIEWYEFQTNDCNYSFDVPSDKLVLEQFDCKNKQQSIKYSLTKKVVN